jgi:hypothetical protein
MFRSHGQTTNFSLPDHVYIQYFSLIHHPPSWLAVRKYLKTTGSESAPVGLYGGSTQDPPEWKKWV